MEVYLDNAATTKIDEKVLRAMEPYLTEKYGNASSLHTIGLEAKRALEQSRDTVAKSIKAKPDEIIFTSGGTESNNLALKGVIFSNPGKKHIITTSIEHSSILETCKWLEKQGIKITYLPVDSEGFVNLEKLNNSITKQTALVSIIHANNEIGTIQNIKEIGKICKEKNVLFHIDACQSFTKVPIDVKKQNIDLMSLNSHKIHGPKGVGALYIRRGIRITPLLHGGGHEKGVRSGTENIAGIVGFAEAIKLAKPKYNNYMRKLRDKLIEEILKIPKTNLNGPIGKNRLCNNINICFNNIDGEAIGGYLNAYNIYSSTGSACSSHRLEPSHVLRAIGLSTKQANSSIRLSLSRFNTKKEIDYVIEILKKVIKKLRKMSPEK